MPPGRPSRLSVYANLDEAVTLLRDHLGGLPTPAEAQDIWKLLWHQEAHHSTALEGNTLVLDEVRKLLDEGRAVGSKELAEYMEVRGYADAAEWVYGQALEPGDWRTGDLISLHEVRTVHHYCMQHVWAVSPHPHAGDGEGPGNWRQHDIHPFAEGMQPPLRTEVQGLMTEWVAQASQLRDKAEAPFPERLAKLHNDFERIHPFLDGNGRAGRLVLNLVLARLGYPPAIIFKDERTKYLKAMRRADRGDYGPLGEVIARAVTNNLYRFVFPAVAGPAKIVPLASLADSKSGLTLVALRAAAERGRLKARKNPQGKWESSKNWVDEYMKSTQDSRARRTHFRNADVTASGIWVQIPTPTSATPERAYEIRSSSGEVLAVLTGAQLLKARREQHAAALKASGRKRVALTKVDIAPLVTAWQQAQRISDAR